MLRRGTGSGRSGNHTPGDAWAVVAPGAHAARARAGAPRLADVASTVAAVCGVDGEGLAGEPLLGSSSRGAGGDRRLRERDEARGARAGRGVARASAR